MSQIRNRFRSLLFPLVTVLPVVSFFSLNFLSGQTQSSSSSTPASDGNNQTPVISTTLSSPSQLGDIFFKSRNSFIFSLNASESYQDNAYYASSADKVADYATQLSGRMAYQYNKGRTKSGLDFTFGRILYNRNDHYDQYIADGGFDLSYLASPRWTISLGDRAGLSPQNGNFLRRDSVLNPLLPTDMPNNTVLLPLNKSIFNTVFFSFSYLMSRRSSLVFSASNTIYRYDQTNLRDQISYSASAGYSYRLSERNTFNFNYAFGYFDATGSTVSTSNGVVTPANLVRSHLAYLGFSRKFSPSLTGSIKGGAIALVTDSLNLSSGLRYKPGLKPVVMGDIEYSPTFDPRTFFSMQASQAVSSGAGLGTVSQIQSASISIGRRFTKKITGSTSGGYSRNQYLSDLDSSGRSNTLNGFFANAQLAVNITERLNLYVNYQRFQQLSTGFSSVIPDRMNGNRVTVGIGYSFPWFF